jgi:hypothetical protein
MPATTNVIIIHMLTTFLRFDSATATMGRKTAVEGARNEQPMPVHNDPFHTVTPGLNSISVSKLRRANVTGLRCGVDTTQSLIEMQVKTLKAAAQCRVNFWEGMSL